MSLDGRVAGPDGGPTAITGAGAARATCTTSARRSGRSSSEPAPCSSTTRRSPSACYRAPGTGRPCAWSSGRVPSPHGAGCSTTPRPPCSLDERDPRRSSRTCSSAACAMSCSRAARPSPAAFLDARLVDRVEWYVAPLLLGAGPVALAAPTSRRAPPGVAVEDVDGRRGGCPDRSVASRYEEAEPRCSPESWRSSAPSSPSPTSATPLACPSAGRWSPPTRGRATRSASTASA